MTVADPASETSAPSRRLLWTSAGVGVGTAFARAILAIAALVAARYLGPTGKGQLALATLASQVGVRVLAAGLATWALTEVASRGAPGPALAVLRRHVQWWAPRIGVTGFLLVVAGSVWGIGPVIASVLVASATGAVALCALALPAGAGRYGWSVGAIVAGSTAFAVTMIGSVVAGVESVPTLVLALVVGDCTAIGVIALGSGRLGLEVGPAASLASWRAAVRVGVPTCVAELTMLGVARLDLVLVAVFLGPAEVGVYSVALSIAELVTVLPDALGQIVQRRSALDDRTGLAMTLRWSVAVVTAAAVIMVVGAKLVLTPLLGAGWDEVAPLLVALSVGTVANAVWRLLNADLAGRNRTQVRVPVALGALAVMVALDLVLIPMAGLIGAGIGSSVALVVAAASTAWYRRRVRADDYPAPSTVSAAHPAQTSGR